MGRAFKGGSKEMVVRVIGLMIRVGVWGGVRICG